LFGVVNGGYVVMVVDPHVKAAAEQVKEVVYTTCGWEDGQQLWQKPVFAPSIVDRRFEHTLFKYIPSILVVWICPKTMENEESVTFLVFVLPKKK